eukprot:Awhi_evm1s996
MLSRRRKSIDKIWSTNTLTKSGLGSTSGDFVTSPLFQSESAENISEANSSTSDLQNFNMSQNSIYNINNNNNDNNDKELKSLEERIKDYRKKNHDPNMSLNALLDTKTPLSSTFLVFLCEEHSEENYLFYQAVDMYKRCANKFNADHIYKDAVERKLSASSQECVDVKQKLQKTKSIPSTSSVPIPKSNPFSARSVSTSQLPFGFVSKSFDSSPELPKR